ncbi:hypothetical protein [Ottowia sp. oral taxon 894]|uniref:hypothetical protein n=1 Tax=Ottowia sp. oral taxon 894 TaxID=1658672 RepID=UPI0012E3248B|nr:hypothetical protein [Ottowia sp. oral taxon 894]
MRLIAQALLGEHRNRLRDFAQGARGFARHLHAARGVGRALGHAIARQAPCPDDDWRHRVLWRGGLFFFSLRLGLRPGVRLRVLLRRVLCLCLGMGLGLRKGGRAGGQRGGGQQTQGGPQGRGAGARCNEVNLLNEGLKTEKIKHHPNIKQEYS